MSRRKKILHKQHQFQSITHTNDYNGHEKVILLQYNLVHAIGKRLFVGNRHRVGLLYLCVGHVLAELVDDELGAVQFKFGQFALRLGLGDLGFEQLLAHGVKFATTPTP